MATHNGKEHIACTEILADEIMIWLSPDKAWNYWAGTIEIITWERSEMYSVGFDVHTMKGASPRQPWIKSSQTAFYLVHCTSNFAKIWMILLPWLWMFSRITTEGSLVRVRVTTLHGVGRWILYCKKRLIVYFKFARVLSTSGPYQILTTLEHCGKVD